MKDLISILKEIDANIEQLCDYSLLDNVNINLNSKHSYLIFDFMKIQSSYSGINKEIKTIDIKVNHRIYNIKVSNKRTDSIILSIDEGYDKKVYMSFILKNRKRILDQDLTNLYALKNKLYNDFLTNKEEFEVKIKAVVESIKEKEEENRSLIELGVR